PLVPVPASVRALDGEPLVLDTGAVIAVAPGSEEAARIGRQLADLIGTTVQSTPRVLTADHPDAARAAIVLALDPAAAARFGAEGYALRVGAAGARIDAAEPAGLFYGTQTFRQLRPARVEYTAALPRRLSVPEVAVEDAPRFGWRGAMLDVSRHFFGVADVKRFIDLLALHKLNRLHLHLSDDQGWRIEIPGWPRLTEHGGSSQVGGRGGGFYTSEDYAEIVRYAAERYITVVPEIDMPGHTNAALSSYPEQLTCDGVAPPLYTGTRVGFSALCDHEPTYAFVDAVVGHLATLTPGPWIHLGGDEVEEMTQEEYNRFVERVQAIVERHGKRMVGWQEIAAARLSPATMVQHWRGSGEALAGTGAGRFILSPASRIDLDMRYHPGTPIGLTWAGVNPLRDAYEWEPAELIEGLDPAAIAGLEAPLWTETVGTLSDIEFLAFPRLAAMAELAWSPADATEWKDFRRRLAAHGLRLTALGVNFYRSPEVDWESW
ncbi:MAG TPA: family 20 glycosylhydrolase, partial [Longimicrobiales bacterium]|nr:family 20 glycosylhydrolase [Longimicrobiales bacterium]